MAEALHLLTVWVTDRFLLTFQTVGLEVMTIAAFVRTLVWIVVYTRFHFGQSDSDSHQSPPTLSLPYLSQNLNGHRAEEKEQEQLRQRSAEPVNIVQDDGKRHPEAPSRLLAMEQDARYPPPDAEDLARWQSALSELELQMTRATFDTWLRPTTLLAWETETGSTRVILGVPNGYVKDWLENRLYMPIQRTLLGILGQPAEVEFEICELAQQYCPSADGA